jgi:hypothetical protein
MSCSPDKSCSTMANSCDSGCLGKIGSFFKKLFS